MTDEVNSVVNGILSKDPDSLIYIKDAHFSGRNIYYDMLPAQCRIVRGWDGGPLSMMQGIDNSFAFSIFIGFHSPASSSGSPLAHSFNSLKYSRIILNDQLSSEFEICYLTSLYYGVPVMLVSGDKEICEIARSKDEAIKTVITQEGISDSVITKTPAAINKELFEASKSIDICDSIFRKEIPKLFNLKISYFKHADAFKASNYPGVKLLNPFEIEFISDDFMDILTAMIFL